MIVSDTEQQTKQARVAREDLGGTCLLIVPWELNNRGGVNQAVISFYRGIEQSSTLRPLILVRDWNCVTPKEEIAAGCRTVRLRLRQPAEYELSLRALIVYIVTLPITLWRLRRLIAKHDIRVVNSQYATLASLTFIILKKLRLFNGLVLLSFHGSDIRNTAKTTGLVKWLWRWLIRNADALITCSKSLADEVTTFVPNLVRPPVAIYNAVSAEELLKEKLSTSAVSRTLPSQYILNVAAYEHKKGHDVLLKAFARIARDTPDVDLVIIGGEGPTWEETNNLVATLGLRGRVICLKDVPHAEVLTYMERATVFAFPSRFEPLGIAMLEAGAFGVSVVASRVDGIPEVINSEKVGILVEVEDDRNLEAALRTLLNNAEARCSLGQQLRLRVVEEFSWVRAWEKYRAVLANPPR